MSDKTSWVLSGIAGLAVTALSLVHQVKKSALRKLSKQGEFEEIEQQRMNAVNQAHHDRAARFSGFEERKELTNIEKEWREKVQAIAQKKHVDSFSGAWNSLSNDVRGKCVVFSAGAGVLMGATTRYITNPKRSWSGNDDNYYFDGGGGHHHHDFGGFGDGGI